jgi:cardiolipin synthase
MEILVTGEKLTGKGFRAFQPAIEELIVTSHQEIHMAVYIFTPSAIQILHLLTRMAEKGIKLTLVINQIESQPAEIRTWIAETRNRFPHARIVDFFDLKGGHLHAKVIVGDRKKAIVGSANFSWGGMVANYEFGVMFDDDSAWKLAAAIDDLARL